MFMQYETIGAEEQLRELQKVLKRHCLTHLKLESFIAHRWSLNFNIIFCLTGTTNVANVSEGFPLVFWVSCCDSESQHLNYDVTFISRWTASVDHPASTLHVNWDIFHPEPLTSLSLPSKSYLATSTKHPRLGGSFNHWPSINLLLSMWAAISCSQHAFVLSDHLNVPLMSRGDRQMRLCC